MSLTSLAQRSAQSESQEWDEKNGLNAEGKVDLTSFSEMAGFPLEFVKRELVLQEDEVSLEQLRSSVMDYLDEAFFKA